jgi:hypothetical protein
MKPCKNCGHAFEEHAIDRNFPDSQRCFHRAGTGEGCHHEYDKRCKNYVDPDKEK